jgi:hypothetical protein
VCNPENCRISNKGVQKLFEIQQLTELRLGSSTEKSEGDNNTFTVVGFKTMLYTLKTNLKLNVLDMQLPHVKELDISGMGTYLLLNVGL